MLLRLQREVERLETWAAAHDPIEYAGSDDLYAAVEEALDRHIIFRTTFTLLLRALRLDDDVEAVQDRLRERPDKAKCIAVEAINCADYRARWQAAVLAGEFADEAVVRRYLADPHEYVRRRALLAARARFPELAEAIALSWLDSSEPYARMVALDTLHALDSTHYPKAIAQLADDDADVVQQRILELGRK